MLTVTYWEKTSALFKNGLHSHHEMNLAISLTSTDQNVNVTKLRAYELPCLRKSGIVIAFRKICTAALLTSLTSPLKWELRQKYGICKSYHSEFHMVCSLTWKTIDSGSVHLSSKMAWTVFSYARNWASLLANFAGRFYIRLEFLE